ncbi:hypothetical protein L4174_012945 [Photobacterium sp. CCB-ST2H9]|uniref:hypothetical protein n=1 Tax=Photobacterium sp. CCB-ST2H9 TaxID=2912855 RepID=UPI002005CAD5|nr:hypothetical protein [Photobacterium sp. CCB-ST2H9]UTM56716.1 hypothetical protein L4174_012945 [Photobacterium sp. CCB-ST2H9]
MASYYFCNGTTSKNKPCQNHVSKEGEKCRFHNGGGGGGDALKATYRAGKAALDAICYLHSCSDAFSFIIDLASKSLELMGYSLKFTSNHSSPSYRTNRQSFAEDFKYWYNENEDHVTSVLESLDVEDFQQFSALCNLLVALKQEEQQDEYPPYTRG